MRLYKCVGNPDLAMNAAAIVKLHSGRVQLNLMQVRGREASLRHLGDGIYEIIAPVQFKAGEIVGYDGSPEGTGLEEITS